MSLLQRLYDIRGRPHPDRPTEGEHLGPRPRRDETLEALARDLGLDYHDKADLRDRSFDMFHRE